MTKTLIANDGTVLRTDESETETEFQERLERYNQASQAKKLYDDYCEKHGLKLW